jgi:hypothetical protein
VPLPDEATARVEDQARRLGAPGVTRAIETVGQMLVDMRDSLDPRIALEVALVRLAQPEADVSPMPPPPPTPSGRTVKAVDPQDGGSQPSPPSPPPAAATPAGDLPSRDELVLAWGDVLLGTLPQKAKPRWAGGRWLGVDGGAALYAVPNDVHRQRCEEFRRDVETVLATHFGRPVPVKLVVDGAAPAATPGAEPEPEPDEIDPTELTDAPTAVASELDPLLQAFPGAVPVEE